MELSRKWCRLCLTETDFNVSLYSNYCRKTNIIDKILVCLKIVIEKTDSMYTICYKCANKVEEYYDFITNIKKSQIKLANGDENRRSFDDSLNRRHVTCSVRKQVIDADYTFSFVENGDEKIAPQASSPFFSYFSPPKRNKETFKRPCEETRDNSSDLFESQSQDIVHGESTSLDYILTSDKNIFKRITEKCFGRSDF